MLARAELLRFWRGANPNGAIAQLGERVLCKHEVVGSIPSGSTSLEWLWVRWRFFCSVSQSFAGDLRSLAMFEIVKREYT